MRFITTYLAQPRFFDLLALPREIRDMIYYHAVVPSAPISTLAIQPGRIYSADEPPRSNGVWEIRLCQTSPKRERQLATFTSMSVINGQIHLEVEEAIYKHAEISITYTPEYRAHQAAQPLMPNLTRFHNFRLEGEKRQEMPVPGSGTYTDGRSLSPTSHH